LGEKNLRPTRDLDHRAGFALNGSKWGGLYLGRRKGDDLVYAGKVDHGFDTTSAKDLRARLKPLIRKTQPYAKKIAHRGIWVEPSLLAEIEYRAKSAEGKVRHPFFPGRPRRFVTARNGCGKDSSANLSRKKSGDFRVEPYRLRQAVVGT
jgi:ATP-dependent DNA ligase